MAKWSGNKVNPEQINNGNEYNVNDNVSIEELNGIVNNSFKAQEDAKRALELAEGANKANGTVVEINGEPQGTWDATHSQKLYEESKNLFNGNLIQKVYVYSTGELVGGGTNYACSEDKISVLPNQSITLSTSTNINVSESGFVFFNNENYVGYSKGVLTTNVPSNANQVVFNLYTDNGLAPSSYANVQLEYGNVATPYHPYNPNRHITNGEAEFLKDEYAKQVNLYEVPNLSSQSANGLTWNVTNHLFNISGTSTTEMSVNFGNIPLEILKSGEQYKLYSTVPYDGSTFNISIAIRYVDGSAEWITPNQITTIKTDVKIETAVLSLYCPSGGISYNYSNVGIMLLKATHNVSKYYPYNGEIIHRGDIEPVLLWENASPNADMNRNTQVLLDDCNNYRKIRILYKRQTWHLQHNIIDGLPNQDLNCVAITGGGLGLIGMYRVASFDGRNVTFENAYIAEGSSAETIDNARIIPVAIYGIK